MIERAGLDAVLKTAQAEERATSLFFLLKRDHESIPVSEAEDIPFQLQRTRMDDDIAIKFAEVLTGLVARLAASKNLQFVEFDPYSIAERHRAEVWAVSNVPVLDRLLQQMEAPAAVDDATLDEDFFETVSAYAVFLHVPGVRLAYFRKFQPSKIIRGGGLKALVQKDTLTQIRKPVFNFDELADALIVGADVLILQKTLFEEMFDLRGTLYAPMAEKAIKQLSTLGLVDDVQGFAQACKQDERKQKKLADIHQNMPLKQLNLAMLSQMKKSWTVDVDLDPSSGQIIFDTQKTWSILKVMDDDYLSSPMTQQLYEVQSKRKVPRRTGAAPRKRPPVPPRKGPPTP